MTSLCLDYNINQFNEPIFEELKEQISLTQIKDLHLRQKMHNQFNMVDLSKLLDQYVDLCGITMHFYFDILYVDKKVGLYHVDGKSFINHKYTSWRPSEQSVEDLNLDFDDDGGQSIEMI